MYKAEGEFLGLGHAILIGFSYKAGVFLATASAPIHWLVYCHMTSNNETVSRQMP